MPKKARDEAKGTDMGITVKKEKDMSEWYTQVVLKSKLADYSPVKGCMVIMPNGYAIWQKVQDSFNERLKELGVKNAYFPLFIPESFFKKEAEHAEGFTPEVAWIANREEGSERLAIRPTSETIMYDSYSRWIRSHRDLPLRMNQWCNVVRWETKATKLFLRTREFLWQEGHCVYETEKECDKETMMMLEEYRNLCEGLLAIPVITGKKTEKEKFAGAKYTLTLEALMPDGKALQMGTSHNLGQDFARSFGISYIGKDEKNHFPWQNSWGFSTRMIGAMVLTHSDNRGLVIPPKVAPVDVVIVPIIFDKDKEEVLKACREARRLLSSQYSVELDDRDEYTAGWKFNEWELKGVPIRLEIGPKDIKKKQAVLVRRDTNEKMFVGVKELKEFVGQTLETMQHEMFDKAKKFLLQNIAEAKSWKEFVDAIKKGKIVKCVWCGETECEDLIKDKTGGATSRCMPLEQGKAKGKCPHCGKEAKHNIYFSKSY